MTSADRPPHRTTSLLRRRAIALSCATLVWVGGLAAAAGPASAAVPSPSSAVPAAVTDAPPSQLQDAAETAVAAGIVGYLARVDDGTRVTKAAAGLADRETGRKLDPGDQFEIGSNTKTFMAVVALQLVADGELGLADTVEQHLPGLVPGGDKITVRMLLQHTSGLFNYTEDKALFAAILDDPKRTWTPEQIVAIATAHKPNFPPGTSWSYSNTNYILVGMILEKITGQTPADLVKSRIAEPLGLDRTYLVSDVAEDTGPGYAHGYMAAFKGAAPTYTDVSDWAIGGWAGTAGAIVSSAGELGRFFQALLGGDLIPEEQLAEMRETVPFPKSFGDLKGGYGLGLMRIDTPCGTVWGHGGDTLGHHSTAVASSDGSRVAVADSTTQLDPRVKPNDAAVKAATAVGIADVTTVCTMFGKPVPASVTSASVATAASAAKAAA